MEAAKRVYCHLVEGTLYQLGDVDKLTGFIIKLAGKDGAK